MRWENQTSIKLYCCNKKVNFLFNHKKNYLHFQKANKKLPIRHLNRFLIFQIVFKLYSVKNLVPSPVRGILVESSRLKQQQLLKNYLKNQKSV